MSTKLPFYRPIDFKIGSISIILYPANDENPLGPVFGAKSDNLIRYLKDLYAKVPEIKRGQYHIVFLWAYNGRRMADVWVHEVPANDSGLPASSGPVVTCYNYCEFQASPPESGMASADSLSILGAEAKLIKEFDSIEYYAHNKDTWPAVDGIRRAPAYGEGS